MKKLEKIIIDIIGIDLRRRRKEIDADLKVIQQIEFVGQLKNINGIILMGQNLCLS